MKYSLLKKIEIIFVNLITFSRLLGAILLPYIYISKGVSEFAFWTIILFLSDFIDGFLARTLKVSTFFGCAMDAFSDKLLNATSFILLSLENNSILFPLILEIAIMYTSYSTYRYGGNVKSTKIGKIKTVILDVCIIFCFILSSLPKYNIDTTFVIYLINNTSQYIDILCSIISVSCLIALLDYVRINKIARNNPHCVEIKYEEKKKKSFKTLMNNAFDINYYANHKNESIMQQFYE